MSLCLHFHNMVEILTCTVPALAGGAGRMTEKNLMSHHPIILFVCEHGSAKSIVAATYFNKLTSEIRVGLRGIARGTDPDQALSPKVLAGLLVDGLKPAEPAPQELSLADVKAARRIISFCELPVEYQHKANIERWDGIPPVSENYEPARDAIIARLNQLLNEIQSKPKRRLP